MLFRSAGTTVYVGGPKIGRPIEIIEARIRDADGIDSPIFIYSRNEYLSMSDKTTKGNVNQICLDPQFGNSKLYTWQACDDVKNRIMMTTRRMISDFDSTSNTGEFPPECLEAVVYNLAMRVAPEFKKVPDEQVLFMAMDSKAKLKGMNRDNTSVFFGYSRR